MMIFFGKRSVEKKIGNEREVNNDQSLKTSAGAPQTSRSGNTTSNRLLILVLVYLVYFLYYKQICTYYYATRGICSSPTMGTVLVHGTSTVLAYL